MPALRLMLDSPYCARLTLPAGAVTASLGDSGVTHLVVADSVEAQDVPPASSRVQVIKQQWFWESIQIEACADEALYQAKVGSRVV